MKKILIIGQSTERSKGGIATVIKGILNSNPIIYGYDYSFDHYISHVDGSVLERMLFFTSTLFKLLITSTPNIALAHIHTACDGSFYRKGIFSLVCRYKGIPTIMHIHGADFDNFYRKSPSIIKRFIRSTLRNSTRVIVLSNHWKVFLTNTMLLSNVEVLYNAVSSQYFKDFSTVPQNIKAFLFLGRLGDRKGIYDLVKAINILINKENFRDLKFYFAGDGEVDNVKKIVNDLGLTGYIGILGWAGDELKSHLLLKTDTIILPSYNEGLPVALLEAMAAGKIVLSTKVGGIPDLVEEGVNGFLINPGDVNDLVLKIKYIAQHPEQMKIITGNNINKIETNFDSVEINKQLFNIYDRVAKLHVAMS